MNQTKSDFKRFFFSLFNKSLSLFEDLNDPDSHYFHYKHSVQTFHKNLFQCL